MRGKSCRKRLGDLPWETVGGEEDVKKHSHTRLREAKMMYFYPWLFATTTFHAINDVKQHWARLVLGWVSARVRIDLVNKRVGTPIQVLTRPNVA